MPFTFSHPALIIPLKRLPARYISMTGLVVGSIAPDFEKFIKMSGGNIYSHTLLGIFWFNLPLSLALAFIFHLVVRNTLIDNQPLFIKSRLIKYRSFNWVKHLEKYPGAVVFSIILATGLHILLDSFTHRDATLLPLMPLLLNYTTFGPFSTVGYVTLMWVVILDLSLSISGLLLILYQFIRLPTQPVRDKPARSFLLFWLVVIALACAIIGLRLEFGELKNNWQLIYVVIGAGLMSILVSSILWKNKTTS